MAVEEPLYDLKLKDDVFEVRDYPALITAEVILTGSRQGTVRAGFRLLANYIFGGNTEQRQIAMTAPVVQTRSGNEAGVAPEQAEHRDSWSVRFLLPSASTLETLPTPDDPQVRVFALPPTRYAVVRFSGLAHPADVERTTTALNTFIARHGLRSLGDPSLARYNPPWILWFMRRNEVMIPIEVSALQ